MLQSTKVPRLDRFYQAWFVTKTKTWRHTGNVCGLAVQVFGPARSAAWMTQCSRRACFGSISRTQTLKEMFSPHFLLKEDLGLYLPLFRPTFVVFAPFKRWQQTTQRQSVSNSQLPTGSNSAAVRQHQPTQWRQLSDNQFSCSSSTITKSVTTGQRQPVNKGSSATTAQQQQFSNNNWQPRPQWQPVDNRELSSKKFNHDDNYNSSVLDNNVCTEGVSKKTPLTATTTTTTTTGPGQQPLGRERRPHRWQCCIIMPTAIMGSAWEQHRHNKVTTKPWRDRRCHQGHLNATVLRLLAQAFWNHCVTHLKKHSVAVVKNTHWSCSYVSVQREVIMSLAWPSDWHDHEATPAFASAMMMSPSQASRETKYHIDGVIWS